MKVKYILFHFVLVKNFDNYIRIHYDSVSLLLGSLILHLTFLLSYIHFCRHHLVEHPTEFIAEFLTGYFAISCGIEITDKGIHLFLVHI